MSLKQLIIEAKGLEEDARELIGLLLKHEPDSSSVKRPSLIRIGIDGRTLGWKYEKLGVDIIDEHEKRQLEER